MELDTIGVGKDKFEHPTRYASISASSYLLIAPHIEAYKIFSAIDEAGYCTMKYVGYQPFIFCDCEVNFTIDDYPDIVLGVSGQEVKISPHNYFWMVPNTKKKVCMGQLIAFDIDYWVLGTPFLKQYYTIFDYDNMRIGMVEATDEVEGYEKEDEDKEGDENKDKDKDKDKEDEDTGEDDGGIDIEF